MRYSFLVFALGLLLGCGGTVTRLGGTQKDGGGGSSDDATARSDAAWSSDSSAGEACSGVRVPAHHRPTAPSCPVARAPSNTGTCCPDAGFSGQWQCSRDSDCTAGKDGRCLSTPGPAGTQCSYDECFTDSDCPGDVPCNCRSSASSYAPNLCATGSNCRVDSDCGPCGFCSPSPSSPNYPTPYVPYFCHTPADTCVDNGDCPDATAGCCTFDPTVRHWACEACPVPPV